MREMKKIKQKQVKQEKTILYFNNELHGGYLEQKTDIIKCVDRLKDLHLKALGTEDIEDFPGFISKPTEYIVYKYWDMFCSSKPKHLNKVTIFESETGISTGSIQSEADFYNTSVQFLKKYCSKDYSPKIGESALIFSTNKKDFACYLDENKRIYYEACKDFIASAKVLQRLGHSQGVIHLVRFLPDLTIENGSAIINLSRFII